MFFICYYIAHFFELFQDNWSYMVDTKLNVLLNGFMLIFGCFSNVISLEGLMLEVPACTLLLTFCQFLFVSILSGCHYINKNGFAPPIIPMFAYTKLTLLHFVTSVMNNYCLTYGIPMTLFIIMRSGALLSSLTMGVLLLGRSYPPYKYISVLLVTVGIVLFSLAGHHSNDAVPFHVHNNTAPSPSDQFFPWFTPMAMMLACHFLSAYLGITQELLFAKYGNQANEALLFNHLLPLPLFVFLYESIAISVQKLMASPHLWWMFLFNLATQYLCIRSVFHVSVACSALTVNILLTLRKLANLLFSVFYFQRIFSLQHAVGTVLVVSGSLLFAGTHLTAWHAFALWRRHRHSD